MRTARLIAGVALATALLGTAACGSSGTSATAGTGSGTSAGTAQSTVGSATGSSGQVTITIKDFGYQDPGSVPAGATVTVRNEDSADHTVTSDDGSAFNAVVKANGGSATFTAPTAVGSYPYHCAYHPSMHGTLVLK